MKKTKVVCSGEGVIDRIKNKSNQDFTDFLGGAPANVACALRKLKIESAFIGCLGRDKFGEKFINKFNELGVNINFVQLANNFPTRIVKVNRDINGDRYFSGFDARSKSIFADEALNKNSIEKDYNSLEKLFLETKYFVTGTNILSSSISTESINYLLSIAKKFDVKVVIDLNWREVFWDYSTFSSNTSQQERVDLVKRYLNAADILKLAREEALMFFENDNPSEISERTLKRSDVIITDGSNPIVWSINGFQGKTEVPNSSQIVDTTGAGDAFLAGLIAKLVNLHNPLNELEIKKCISFASICGLLTCLGEGAIEQQPDYERVNEFLGSQIL